MTEREIFFEALEMSTPEARAAYLLGACGKDVTLRRKVDGLLREHLANDSLLAGPALKGERGTIKFNPAPAEAPAQVIDRYKLLEKIGEGGMGEVWMAEQREPIKRRVALKIVKLGMDSRQIVARFEAERQALAMMDHPNIAKIFDAGTTENPPPASGHPLPSDGRGAGGEGRPHFSGGRPYFVMELVRGIKITEYCDQNQFSTRERLNLFILVCQAIQHAHQKGVIHRDIKPSNILVTLHDGVAVPKVIDFGIAKATQQELTDKTVFTQFQQFIGTPAYISPEQAEMSGLDIDTRADIYSLGVLLYELLVGQTPFDAQELMQGGLDALRKIIREKEPVRPSTKLNTLRGEARTTAGKRRQTDVGKVVHQLEGDLDWIVMKCLEKDRTRRYDTANGLAADLKRHLANEPVVACPPSAAYRFQKAWQRNKLVFTAGTVVLVALIVGVGVSTWQAIRATRASASEAAQRKLAEVQRNAAVEQRKLADMQLALQAWEEGDLQRANDLIEASRPEAGQTAAFEWRYLRKLCEAQCIETFGSPHRRYRSALFLDRDLLLLNDGKALTLQDSSGREGRLLLEDQDGLLHVALCRGNSNLLATVTDDGRIKVWNLAAKRVQVEFEGHPRSSLAQLHTVTFSRDGKWLASSGSDNSVKLWDVEARNPTPVRTVHRYASWVCGAAFSSDSSHLFSGGSESMIRIWNVATGMEAGVPLAGYAGWIYALAVAPDGLRLASGGSDGTVIVWDVMARQHETKLFGHRAQVMSLAFSPDQRTLAAGGTDHTIRLWDLKTGQPRSLLRGHGAGVRSLSYSPDGQRLISRSADGLVKLWQVTPGMGGIALTGGREVALSPDGRQLASIGGSEFGVSLWDLTTRSLTVLNGHSGFVVGVAFSPDGRILATSSHDQTVKLWDVGDHKAVATLTNGFPAGSLAFSPDGHTLIVGGSKFSFMVGDRGGLQYWDVASRKATGAIPGDTSSVVQVALSASGSLLATSHKDGPVRLWNAHTRQLLHAFMGPPGSWVSSLTFSPTEPLLAAGDWGGNIELYNVTTMEVVPLPLQAHTQRVMWLAFSPDGRTLASAGEGGGLRLWRVAMRQLALTLKESSAGIAFSRDGTFMASCGRDATVQIWPAATPEAAAGAAKAKAGNQ